MVPSSPHRGHAGVVHRGHAETGEQAADHDPHAPRAVAEQRE
jgi:hypothetical protein